MREGQGPGSHVWCIPRPAPASAADRAARLERCRAIVGPLCHLRLLTEAPGPSRRKRRSRTTAHQTRVDILGIVARAESFLGRELHLTMQFLTREKVYVGADLHG